MTKKDSIDELLYQYAENILNEKYDTFIEKYYTDEKFKDLEMNVSFEEFWENKDKIKKTIQKKKKRKRIVTILVASLIFTVVFIGPKELVTYAKEIYSKIVTVLEDRTNIEYNSTESNVLKIKEPTYIPENYSIVDRFNEDNVFSLTYSNGIEEESIFYQIYPMEGMTLSLDTEESKIYSKKINNMKINCIENDKANTAYYENEHQIYLLTGKINIDELIKMLESLTK